MTYFPDLRSLQSYQEPNISIFNWAFLKTLLEKNQMTICPSDRLDRFNFTQRTEWRSLNPSLQEKCPSEYHLWFGCHLRWRFMDKRIWSCWTTDAGLFSRRGKCFQDHRVFLTSGEKFPDFKTLFPCFHLDVDTVWIICSKINKTVYHNRYYDFFFFFKHMKMKKIKALTVFLKNCIHVCM